MSKKFEHIVFDSTQLDDSYHVQINTGYAASVYNLKSLVSYLSTDPLIDGSFGEIVKHSCDEYTSQFEAELNDILDKYKRHVGMIKKDFATFNSCKHTYIETTENIETISILTKAGRKITISIFDALGSSSCADIKIHNGSEKFKVMGFDGGKTPIPQTEVTLLTALFKE